MCFGGPKIPSMPKMESPKPPPIPTKPAMVLDRKKKSGRRRAALDTSSLRIPKALSSPTRKSGLSIPTYS